MKFDKKALIEAVQEVARIAFFGAVSTLIATGLDKLTGLPQTEFVVIGTLFLKFLDKYIHDNKFTSVNGLTDTNVFNKEVKKKKIKK